ncbi:hypothetical protein GWO43_23280, partial [candidate division KSB1 bacterium]|nr:hypothetical protein [candidate division KSB1 bacterium]NIR70158.1 hypothetical protein [candidate division KSB1 bacterium]NIS26909.1 hypothetical protein [candidate division KSB1 bacterium]NIT73742.1 hypothetical protein [candidate division KSB1 bacterium]NIU27640.1 hypothetical protein [candidate division KSB1 bacterium]
MSEDKNNKELLKGAYDIHVHAAPSIFPRWGDADDLVRLCDRYSMAGVVLKAHHGDTVALAQILNKQYACQVSGGVVLNQFVGGLNPACVEAALHLGAKIIWLPTLHARNHRLQLGSLGSFHFQKSGLDPDLSREIAILDESGNLLDPMKKILRLLTGEGLVLATGHVGKDEIFALHRYIVEHELDINLLVNHVFFTAPGLELEDLAHLHNDQTWFEISHLTYTEITRAASYDKVVSALKKHPEFKWVMVSDSGQTSNLKCPEALAQFASELRKRGVAEGELTQYLKENPRVLL